MKVRMFALIVAASAFALPAIAQNVPAVVVAEKYTTQAEVMAVDYTARTATLKTEDGVTSTIPLGPEVKNLGQLKKGDIVQAQFSQALQLSLRKKGAPAYRQDKTEAASAAPGEKPAAAAMHQVNFVADIIKLDAKTGELTVKGVKNTVNLKVEDPKVLQGYVVGDQVEGVFLEVLAIGAVAPGAKK